MKRLTMQQEWNQFQTKNLARFVNRDSANFFDFPPSLNHHTLSNEELIEEIYKQLICYSINYAPEPHCEKRNTQLIRDSDTIKRDREGTCLDLSLMFCSICARYDLLPMIIVIKDHALAAVSTKHKWKDWNSRDRNERELLRDVLTDKDALSELINSEDYIPIECTGFARDLTPLLSPNFPEGVGREKGLLSFDKAVDAGKKQLDVASRQFKFAIDIAVAHEYWECRPQPQPQNPSLSSAAILEKMQSHRKLIRSKLNPNILRRIDRQVIDKKCFDAIEKSIQTGNRNIIPIVGPAGSGKTVTLGKICDAASEIAVTIENNHHKTLLSGWVALVLCDEFSSLGSPDLTADQLSIKFAEITCGISKSFIDIASDLTRHYGKGILLIDTIDLILSKNFIIVFRQFLQQLLSDVDITVVFTCRDQEYEDYCKGEFNKFSEIANRVEEPLKNSEWNFSDSEIRAAVLSYAQYKSESEIESEIDVTRNGEAFAENILTLEVDQRSFQEITRKPLLLALLCDLYFKIGKIQSDLTVNKLYETYWEKRIQISRRYSSGSLEEKYRPRICLDLSHKIFDISLKNKRFHDSISEDIIVLDCPSPHPEHRTRAYDELHSDKILNKIGQVTPQITFFHQTFSEYAIAVWLRQSSVDKLEELLTIIANINSGDFNISWLAIVRQLLSIVEPNVFDYIYSRLEKKELKIFRTISFSIVSREDIPKRALNELCEIASSRGYQYQKCFFNAIEYSVLSLTEDYLKIALVLLKKIDEKLAAEASQVVGILLNRIQNESFNLYLEKAFEAISQIQIKADDKRKIELRMNFFGKLIAFCEKAIKSNVTGKTLGILRNFYPDIGGGTQILILELHASQVSIYDKSEFIKMLFKLPQLKKNQERVFTKDNGVATCKLFYEALPYLIGAGENAVWSNYLVALKDDDIPDVLNSMRALAIGRIASSKLYVLAEILKDFIDFVDRDESLLRSYLKVLDGAIRYNASDLIVLALLMIRPENINPKRYKKLAALLKQLCDHVCEEDWFFLIQWISPLMQENPEDFKRVPSRSNYKGVNSRDKDIYLKEDTPTPSKTIRGNNNFLSEKKSSSKKSYQHPPVALEEYLLLSQKEKNKITNSFDTKQLSQLISDLLERAKTSDKTAIFELFELSKQKPPEIASKASNALIKVADQLKFEDLMSLVSSKVAGVRAKSLEGILIKMRRCNSLITEENIMCLFNYLCSENNQEALKKFFAVFSYWTKESKYIPESLIHPIGDEILKLIKRQDNKLSEFMIGTFQNIVNKFDSSPIKQKYIVYFRTWTIQLLILIDGREIQSGVVIGIVASVAKLDFNSGFLDKLVDQVPNLSEPSGRAIAKAIRDVAGNKCTSLTRLLENPQCLEITKVFISDLIR